MKALKNTLISIIALVTACGLLATAALAEEAAAPAQTGEQTEEAVAQADPIEGSWVLYEVYDSTNSASPVLLKKEENQSLYGSGISIYTFDKEGAAHHNMIDGGDNKDEEATWQITEPGVYTYTEGAETMTLQYKEGEDTLHQTFQEDSRTLDFVYARAMVGSWKLDKVLEIHEGDASVDLPKEGNQSLYGSGESVLTFFTDGKANDKMTEGPDQVVREGSWKLTAPDAFTYTEDTIEMEFQYFRADDTIFRDFVNDAADADHAHLRFVYGRVNPEPEKAPEQQTTTAQAATKPATQPATQPTTQASQTKPKRTGYSLDLVAVSGGDAITIYALDNGSYEDDYGIIYTEEGGGGPRWYGSNGSVWIIPEEYEEGNNGQIFTGFEMNLYDPDTGEQVVVKELTQGGYANEWTGVVYTQEGGGGDHWYGTDGSVLISEWLYYNSDEEEEEDELIADGQIFSGEELNLYGVDSGGMIVVDGLNQGGYVDQDTGVMYYQDSEEDWIYHGTDGSTWTAE